MSTTRKTKISNIFECITLHFTNATTDLIYDRFPTGEKKGKPRVNLRRGFETLKTEGRE